MLEIGKMRDDLYISSVDSEDRIGKKEKERNENVQHNFSHENSLEKVVRTMN
jgi:hypothetical protein